MYYVVLVLLCVTALLAIQCTYHPMNLVVRSRASIDDLGWKDIGPTPLSEKKYTPQGMTWSPKGLVFANTWKNQRSRVYEFDPKTMEIKRHFDMPEEAVHTSGLAFDGKHLWAADFVSRRVYSIDMERSFEKGRAQVLGSFRSNLQNLSACAIVQWAGQEALAVSDFMHSRNTVILDHHSALESESAEGHVLFSYRNEGFSQGLVFVDGYLYEAENKLGKDIINKLDMFKLKEYGTAKKATVQQFNAPSKGVEDLAWDGEWLWTSDESTFRFYKTRLE